MNKEVSKRMPAHIHVDGVIKKWRVPIFSTSFEYKMALVPHSKFVKPGDVLNTWNTVGFHLQNFGKLAKEGKAWKLLGRDTPTLDAMRDLYLSDTAFQLECQRAVLANMEQIDVPKEESEEEPAKAE